MYTPYKKRVFCTERTVQRNDFELISTVKMDTRHPVQGSFGSEFQAICSHRGVMAAESLKTPKRRKVKTIFGRSLGVSRIAIR